MAKRSAATAGREAASPAARSSCWPACRPSTTRDVPVALSHVDHRRLFLYGYDVAAELQPGQLLPANLAPACRFGNSSLAKPR